MKTSYTVIGLHDDSGQVIAFETKAGCAHTAMARAARRYRNEQAQILCAIPGALAANVVMACEDARKAAYVEDLITADRAEDDDTVRVDPFDFRASEWEELWNATEEFGFIPPNEDRSPAEAHHNAEAFDALRDEVKKAIAACRARAAEVAAEEDRAWEADLVSAAETLEGYLGTCSCESRSWYGDEHDSACDLAGLRR